MKSCLVFVVGTLVLMVSCSMHRPETHIPECNPLPEPLTVDSGVVSIECAARPGMSDDFDCTIRDGAGVIAKKGIFMFTHADWQQAVGFDPKDAHAYAIWDGCFTISLRDGRLLEEVEIITSGAGKPSDWRRSR